MMTWKYTKIPTKKARAKNSPLVWSCRELTKGVLLPTPPRTWRRRAGGQLKVWATTTIADLEPISWTRVFEHARWRKDSAKVSIELAQDRRD